MRGYAAGADLRRDEQRVREFEAAAGHEGARVGRRLPPQFWVVGDGLQGARPEVWVAAEFDDSARAWRSMLQARAMSRRSPRPGPAAAWASRQARSAGR